MYGKILATLLIAVLLIASGCGRRSSKTERSKRDNPEKRTKETSPVSCENEKKNTETDNGSKKADSADGNKKAGSGESGSSGSSGSSSQKTVVSVQKYDDCDGSGHGVKIITYSDGTQEEEYF